MKKNLLNFKKFESSSDEFSILLKKYSMSHAKIDHEDLEFLKSLNLTEDQYIKLSRVFINYGDECYLEGKDNGSYPDPYEETMDY